MSLLAIGTAVFVGLAVCMAMIYSLAQALMTEGRQRVVNIACIVLVLMVMTAATYNAFPVARLLALPLLGAGLYAMWLEPGWYRAFPVLYQVFAAILLVGMTP